MILKSFALLLISLASLPVAASSLRTTNLDVMDAFNLFDSGAAHSYTQTVATLTGSGYAVVLPASQGGANTCQMNDGSGNLTWQVPAGTGVTAVSIATAHGFSGSSSGGTTPSLTVNAAGCNGVCSANGTTLATAAAGTDYQAPISSTTAVAHQFLTAFAAPNTFSQAQPAASDLSNGVTGSGAIVLAISPTLVTPILGVAAATTINNVAITAPATGSTLTIADGKTFTASNTLTFAGTDSSTLNIGAGGTLGSAAFIAAPSGTSSQLLANSGSAGFANVSVGTGLSLTGGTLSASGSGSLDTAMNSQSGTSYTLALTDAWGNGNFPMLKMTSSSNNTVTVPPHSSVAFSTSPSAHVQITQNGTGISTVAEGSGVSIVNCIQPVVSKQYGILELYQTSTDTWFVHGDYSCAVASYLIVAQGGGGASNGGGGGGGGVVTGSGLPITIQSYTIVVGAGSGAGGTSGGDASNGANSSAFGQTANGGSGGAGHTNNVPTGGGGGGGGGTAGPGNKQNNGGAGGTGGFAGGSGGTDSSSFSSGGGGGGACVAAANFGLTGGASATTGGNGGAGCGNSLQTGSSQNYGGGGGGGTATTPGTGGVGGGGNGANTAAGSPGTANTGGGGGGNNTSANPGGVGGTGIVVISVPHGSITATGGTMTTVGANDVYTFTSSGTWNVTGL